MHVSQVVGHCKLAASGCSAAAVPRSATKTVGLAEKSTCLPLMAKITSPSLKALRATALVAVRCRPDVVMSLRELTQHMCTARGLAAPGAVAATMYPGRYLLQLDGFTGSYRLAHLMHINSMILKSDSPYVEWFYR